MRGVEVIKKKIVNIPNNPGIYQMLGEKGEILYIGKAKNLKKRVLSYANTTKLAYRIQIMVSGVYDVNFTITKTEAEALLLEASLIKSFKPYYNIEFKDDKSFPYLAIDMAHPFPRIMKYRGSKKKSMITFGPFTSVLIIKKIIIEIQKLYQLRPCSNQIFQNRTRPCLQYQIHRCSAPCVNKISKDEYNKNVESVKEMLLGKNDVIREKMTQELNKASESLEFERAAIIRDRISLFAQIQSFNTFHLLDDIGNADIIGLHRNESLGIAVIEVLIIRDSENRGSKTFFLGNTFEISEKEILEMFLMQFYHTNLPAKQIILSHAIDADIVMKALYIRFDLNVQIKIPQRGRMMEVLGFVIRNAQQSLESYIENSMLNAQNLHMVAEAFSIESTLKRV